MAARPLSPWSPSGQRALAALLSLLAPAVAASGQTNPRSAAALLVPFGPSAGDAEVSRADDSSSPEINLGAPMPYFGASFGSLWVGTNGIISFNASVTTYTPEPFPFNGGTPMIAPFWSDVDIRNGGQIFYRESTDASTLAQVQRVLDAASTGVVGFEVETLFVATWSDVAFFGGFSSSNRNTFQCILATDGRRSFAIFLYASITWTTGTASGGNSAGLGGTAAQVGFDAGDGERFFAIPQSRTPEVLYVDSLSNVDQPGVYIFQIQEASITRNCSSTTSAKVVPEHGSWYGGELLTISTEGTCFEAAQSVTCVFTLGGVNMSVPGVAQDGTSARCHAPPLGVNGRATLEVSTDGGAAPTVSAAFTFRDHECFVPPMQVTIDEADWAATDDVVDVSLAPHDFQLTWDPDLDGLNGSSNVTIFLEVMASGTIRDALVLAGSAQNSGSFTFTSNEFTQLSEQLGIPYFSFVVSMVASSGLSELLPPSPALMDASDVWRLVSEAGHQIYKFASLKLFHFGRMIRDAAFDFLFDMDYDFSQLEACPCRAELAVTNPNWVVDAACSGSGTENDCFFHDDGLTFICYRQRRPSGDGSGNQCCYTEEGVLNTNKEGAGTADRYHPGNCGLATWRECWRTGLHFWYDVVPTWFMDIDDYLEGRPMPTESTCSNQQFRPAAAFGDPHLRSLDGFPFTFNGAGEFVYLLEINGSLQVQVRMEPLGAEAAARGATIITAVALQAAEGGVTIQVGFPLFDRNQVEVRADGVVQSFDACLDSKEYAGGIVVSMDVTTRRSVTVVVNPLLELSITAADGALAVVVSASWALMSKTHGLVGFFDGDKTNDLLLRNGSVFPLNTSASSIHTFGLSWIVDNASASLFSYRGSQSFATFYDPGFVPLLMDSLNEPPNVSEATTCGASRECLFDLRATGSAPLASGTAAQAVSVQERVELSENITSLLTSSTTTATTTSTTTATTTTTITTTVTTTFTATASETTSPAVTAAPTTSATRSTIDTDTIRCSDVRHVYRQSKKCCGAPMKVLDEVSGATCADVVALFKQAGCCGNPSRVLPRPSWIKPEWL